MGVDCKILILKPRGGIHKSGGVITGLVKYIVNKPTEFQDVTLSLFGKAKAHWTENLGKHSYTGLQELITRHVNVTNKEPGQTVTLHGDYKYPFEFDLPENLPPSYKDTTGKINYMIQLRFEKTSFFSIDKVFSEDFIVYGDVNPIPTLAPEGLDEHYIGPVIFGLEKKLFAPLTKEKCLLKLKAQIAKSCVRPGESLQLSYEVSNLTNVAVRSVSAVVYCYTIYSCGRNTKVKEQIIHGCVGATGGVLKGKVGNLSCVVPTRRGLLSLQNCEVISKDYRVRVTVNLPGTHKDAVVEVPIVIGELKSELNPQHLDHLQIDNDPSPPPYISLFS